MDEFERALVQLHASGAHDLERGISADAIAEATGLSKSAVMELIYELQASGRAHKDLDANQARGIAARLRAKPTYLRELGVELR